MSGSRIHDDGTIAPQLKRAGVNRRDFISFCGKLMVIAPAGLAITSQMSPAAVAAEIGKARRPSVIWLHMQDCTGCTETLLRTSTPDVADLILNVISLDYHETLMAASGHDAELALQEAMAANDKGLTFKPTHPDREDAYKWMGFEAREQILAALDEAIKDKADVYAIAYDLNLPEIVDRLKKVGKKLKVIIDDSKNHKPPTSAESAAERMLKKTAGAGNVRRQHMSHLQHNKTIVVDGKKVKKVICGSTNLSWRGFYVQNNNAMVLLLFMLALPVFTFVFGPLTSLSSRKHEFEADAFAAQHTDARDLVSALVKMYEDNASTLTPDPLHSAFYDSHPPASVRIRQLNLAAH